MQGPYLRRYGVASNVNFVLYGTSGKAFNTGASFATDDVMIMKDNGVEAASATGFADEGQGYSLPVSSSEMTGQRIVIYAVDQGTKTWLDTNMVIETYGHPSAMHGFNLDSTTVDVGLILGASSEVGKLITVSTALADLNDVSTTDILTQSNISLIAYDLDHLVKIDKAGVSPTSGSIFDLVINKSTNQTFDQANDSLEAIRDRGDAEWITGGGTGTNYSSTDVYDQVLAGIAASTIDADLLKIITSTSAVDKMLNFFDGTGYVGGTIRLKVNSTETADFNDLSTTDILTQVNLSTGVSGNFALVAGLKDISTTDVLTQVNLSTGVSGNFALVAGLKDISTTDVLTQVNLSTGVAGNFALVAGLKDISTTDVFTQSNAAMVNLNLDNLINIDALGTDPTTGTYLDLIMNKNGSQTFSKADDSLEAIRDRGDAEWITNILTSTDIITQVDLSTGVAGNFAAVAGLNDISTTDILTQVNLSDASTFDPTVDLINATLTYQKAMNDLTAESFGQVFKTGNAYAYLSTTGGELYTLTVTSSDRTRTS